MMVRKVPKFQYVSKLYASSRYQGRTVKGATFMGEGQRKTILRFDRLRRRNDG
jgi:hypothetical protein